MYFFIKNNLVSVETLDFNKCKHQYVAVISSSEWENQKEQFDMGIEMELDPELICSTKVDVNFDSLTGSFYIPDRNIISGQKFAFSFALDEKGIVFIDDSGFVNKQIENIIRSKRWSFPSLERFIYDFLEMIVSNDQTILENTDKKLDSLESEILSGNCENPSAVISKIRSDLRDMRIHYEQLLDLAQELEENENDFFKKNNLRYFHMFSQRVSRLHDMVNSLREYSTQIRELYQSQLDIRQNHIMTLLTVLTSIFMPLTLITGWFGMNFKYMPELEMKPAYPVVIVLSIFIVIISLVFFKKKKWL